MLKYQTDEILERKDLLCHDLFISPHILLCKNCSKLKC